MLESPYGLHLPIFPCFYDKPSEDRLEAVVSRLMDRADSALLSGKATQVQYDAWIKALDRWTSSVKTTQ
jgi:hypothetical protein